MSVKLCNLAKILKYGRGNYTGFWKHILSVGWEILEFEGDFKYSLLNILELIINNGKFSQLSGKYFFPVLFYLNASFTKYPNQSSLLSKNHNEIKVHGPIFKIQFSVSLEESSLQRC